MRQEPSSRVRKARSAESAICGRPWLIARDAVRARGHRRSASRSRRRPGRRPAGNRRARASAGRMVGEAEPVQPRHAPAASPCATPSSSLRSRVCDIAAKIDDVEIRPQAQRHGAAAQRRGAEHRALRQIARAIRRIGDRKASRTSSRGRKAEQLQPVGQEGRHVLRGMDGEIDLGRRCSASSISLVNRPLPPTSDSGRSWIRSPEVRDDDDLDLDAASTPWKLRRAGRASHAPGRAPAGCRACRCGGAAGRRRIARGRVRMLGRGSIAADSARSLVTTRRNPQASRPIRVERPPRDRLSVLVLGIETSCDETAASVVASRRGEGMGEILLQRRALADRRACGLWRRRAGDRGARPCRGARSGRRRRRWRRLASVLPISMPIAATAGSGPDRRRDRRADRRQRRSRWRPASRCSRSITSKAMR